MSTQALYEKLDHISEILSVKLAELVRLAALENSEDDDADQDMYSESNEKMKPDISTATTGVMMINNQTTQLIKGVQDLLVLTRSIREKWLLNQIPEQRESDGNSIDHEQLGSLLDKCMNEIIGESNG